MADLATLEAELEQERRSLAMLPPSAPLTRETAIALIERCQQAIRAAREIS
ncbi:MAG: hypothetical protein JJE52_13550 [Acidimicrobiia bacterium]|nr:hypothetical protein [Acidimicrobiia bacterium]